LQKCKKTQKSFRGKKNGKWPELENELEDWVNTQRADGRGVSTVQIRLKAKVMAKSKNIENFGGGPSWCMRFMRRKGLSVRARTTMCQALPADYEEKMNLFRNFTREKIAEDLIGPNDVINMDEVPLTFDLPLTRTVNKKGESSVTLKTTGHEKTHFTCVLACTGGGQKLFPMVIFKRIIMPKETFPKGSVVKVNKKGWVDESMMKGWLQECFARRPGGFFRQLKSMLVMDSMRAHITDAVKEAIKKNNAIPAIIPGGLTKHLQPLDIAMNKPFKTGLRTEWERWMSEGEKSFIKTGRLRRASFAEVCQWILTVWEKVKPSAITNGFRKAGILELVADEQTSSGSGSVSSALSDESDAERGSGELDERWLQLFMSDTESSDFSGFRANDTDSD
jgi:hypothetical protein